MRFALPPCCYSIGLSLLLLAGSVRAQTAAPTPGTPPAAAPAPDVILRLDGEEVAGRVLLITPTVLRYLPAPAASAPPGTDTLQVPAADVFLVRYANGTREVLTRPVGAAPVLGDGRLDTLSGPERQRLGHADARRYYHGRDVFWRAAGVFWFGAPGLVAVAISAGRPVRPAQLRAPLPALLQDPDYGLAYQQQANRIKRGKTWAGYTTAAGILLGIVYMTTLSERR